MFLPMRNNDATNLLFFFTSTEKVQPLESAIFPPLELQEGGRVNLRKRFLDSGSIHLAFLHFWRNHLLQALCKVELG